jgi:UDP-glucose 4-epimerase
LKVLVTGGAGFIGSHVVEELLGHQYEVVVVDNLVTGFLENLPKDVKLHQMDLNDPKFEGVFEQEKPDYVIHLAAQASVALSMTDPNLDFYTNTVGTFKTMLLSKKYNVRKIIFASTAAVYGEPLYLPIDEEHLLNPLSFYSLSKFSAENYIKYNDQVNGLDSCILRFSNVYGPRQNAYSEAGVIAIFLNRLLADESVSIYDGSQTRDFIYVKDVVLACRLAMESDHKGVFNISSCTETKIDDLFYLIAGMTKVNRKPVHKPLRIGEIKKSILDNGRARKELNWDIQHSLLEGLRETFLYYSQLPN